MSEGNGNGHRLLGKDLLKDAAHSSTLTGLSRVANLVAPLLLSALLYMGQTILTQQEKAREQTLNDVKDVRATVIELQNKYGQTAQQVQGIQATLATDQTLASSRTETRRTEAIQIAGQLGDLKARMDGVIQSIDALARRLDGYQNQTSKREQK